MAFLFLSAFLSSFFLLGLLLSLSLFYTLPFSLFIAISIHSRRAIAIDLYLHIVSFSPGLFLSAEPNDESAANVSAAKMWREDREQFERIADALVRKTLALPPLPE